MKNLFTDQMKHIVNKRLGFYLANWEMLPPEQISRIVEKIDLAISSVDFIDEDPSIALAHFKMIKKESEKTISRIEKHIEAQASQDDQ